MVESSQFWPRVEIGNSILLLIIVFIQKINTIYGKNYLTKNIGFLKGLKNTRSTQLNWCLNQRIMKLKQKWGDLPIMNKHAVVNKEKNMDIVAMTATFEGWRPYH